MRPCLYGSSGKTTLKCNVGKTRASLNILLEIQYRCFLFLLSIGDC